MRQLSIGAFLLLSTSVLAAQRPRSTIDVVVAGMTCRQSAITAGSMNCEYSVGSGLKFSIAGVGQEDAGITVERSTGYDSDYYLSFGILHGCVIIKPGRLTTDAARAAGVLPEMAFVSPRTGKVYESWQECQRALGE